MKKLIFIFSLTMFFGCAKQNAFRDNLNLFNRSMVDSIDYNVRVKSVYPSEYKQAAYEAAVSYTPLATSEFITWRSGYHLTTESVIDVANDIGANFVVLSNPLFLESRQETDNQLRVAYTNTSTNTQSNVNANGCIGNNIFACNYNYSVYGTVNTNSNSNSYTYYTVPVLVTRDYYLFRASFFRIK